jgi:hypothetical protein
MNRPGIDPTRPVPSIKHAQPPVWRGVVVVGWICIVLGAYLVENSAYFQEKFRIFLPLLIGR